MRILYAASEVFPFAKTGGLGDVAGALPKALTDLGHDVRVILPLYRKIRRRKDPLREIHPSVSLRFAGEDRPFRLLEGRLPGSAVPVVFVENAGYFEVEDEYYGTAPGSYGDAHLRFLYFAHAIPLAARAIGFVPEVFHLNDWQTAFAAVLLKTVFHLDPGFRGSACALSLHNMAYQGVFPVEDVRAAGVEPALLSWRYLLEGDTVNLLKGGILFADVVNAVSRTYAFEIQTPECGAGLETVLRERGPDLHGVVNGLDTEVWNPARDPAIAAPFSAADLAGKKACRDALLRELDLAAGDGPVLAAVSRLTAQKGIDLIVEILPRILEDDAVRLVVLGSGDPDLEERLAAAERLYPGRMKAILRYDEDLSHRIEAGADIFLMPSRYEPCGLSQLISLRYGAVPVVRATGGLADTVVDATATALADGTATGFVFRRFHADDLLEAIDRAVALRRRPEEWRRLVTAGMSADWSWRRSALDYVDLYGKAMTVAGEATRWKKFLSHIPIEPTTPFLEKPPDLPGDYHRDTLRLFARDPHTLYASYEMSGPRTAALLAGVPDAGRAAARWFLRVTDHGRRRTFDVDISPLARGYYLTVTPHAAYSADLLLALPDSPPALVASSGMAFVPRSSDVHAL